MVYVNSKKYACESCIKGHRSSNCHHNDRPLFEIKKKGRPVSQCDKCREARQARRIHSKCTCDMEKDASAALAAVARKGKRFIPTVPSLPNGLKDAFKTPELLFADSSGPKQPVDALLNPCHCKDIYTCRCRSNAEAGSSSAAVTTISSTLFNDGLSALALVAACCSPASPSTLPPLMKVRQPSSNDSTLADERTSNTSQSLSPLVTQLSMSISQRPTTPAKRKRSPQSSADAHRKRPVSNPSFSKIFQPTVTALPLNVEVYTSVRHDSQPGFSPIITPPNPPSVSASATVNTGSDKLKDSETDANCCCGIRCECAGCSLHGAASPGDADSWVEEDTEAGPSTSYRPSGVHRADCTPDCLTCVDHEGGVELPPLSGVPGVATGQRAPAPSFLDAFFARAASLPAPPPAAVRKSFDPTNVVVYPRSLFERADGDSHADERPRAFGLVRVPKLEECCGGRCGCTEDACGCGDACGGCCMDGGESALTESRGGEGSSSRASTAALRLSPSVSFARQAMAPALPSKPIPGSS